MTDLVDIINYVKPTALLGLSTIKVCLSVIASLFQNLTLFQNAFSEQVVKAMSALNKRPIIFPLSNPVSLCEVAYQDAIEW
jgi:malate dehydrogenase (oxaloacetate-decarboxylating)(NADP+)